MTRSESSHFRIRRALALLLAAAVCAVALSACQAQPTGSSQRDEKASEDAAPRIASKVEIADGQLFLGEDETLWTARVADDGSIEDFEDLGKLEDRVRGIVVFDGMVYVRTISGVYAMEPDATVDGAELIVDADASDGLWATSEGLFYLGGGVLGGAPLSGSDGAVLREGVKDFVVAGGSIYVLDEDGAFVRIGLDGEGEVEIDSARDRHDEAVLVADGDDVYLVSDEVLVCRDGGDAAEEVGLAHEVGVPDRTIVFDGAILYESDSVGSRYLHVDGDDEKLEDVNFRGKGYSCIHGGFLYWTILGDEVTVVDLETFESEVYDHAESAAKDADDDEGSKDSDDLEWEPIVQGKAIENGSSGSSFGGYDIGEGMGISAGVDGDTVSTAHFTLRLNGDALRQGLWVVEQVNDTTIKFAHSASRAAGFDGTVFTLRAYDWGDSSYADIPNTRIAGASADKKYVIIMPTDVRYDASNAAQADEYNRLRAYAETIDENANPTGNPFAVVGA